MRGTKLSTKINLVILSSCIIVTILFGIVFYLFEKHRHEQTLDKIKLLMKSIVNQKYEDLSSEITYYLSDALEITFQDMIKVDGIVSLSVYHADGHLIHTTGTVPDDADLLKEKKTLYQTASFFTEKKFRKAL